MIWVTWQQYRRSAVIGTAALVLVAAIVFGIGLKMAADFHDSGLAACVVAHDHAGRCATIGNDFARRYVIVAQVLNVTLPALPLLVGLFIGAPLLADELEHGTHRLAWTQSVTRWRWASVKLGLAAATVTLAGTAVSLIGWWWHRPLDQLFGGPFAGFDTEGVTPVAYALFAFALGVTAGLLIRNTVWAMAVTVTIFVALRFGLALLVRPFYLPPSSLTVDLTRFRGSIRIAGNTANPLQPFYWGGDPFGGGGGAAVGPGPSFISIAFNGDWRFDTQRHGSLAKLTFLYQPADRFWALQGIEAAIFLGLAALLLAVTVWWLRTRVA